MTFEALFQTAVVVAAVVMAAVAWRRRIARPSLKLERVGIVLTALAVAFAAPVHGDELVLAGGLFAIFGGWAVLFIAVCAAIEAAIASGAASVRRLRDRHREPKRVQTGARRRQSSSTARA